VSLSRGSWALFPPAKETLRADSWAVTCCPEDGRLTFGGWVVVVKELTPTTISIYQWFNNHLNVQGSSPVVETSAGVPLISMRPFVVPKWPAWLVSKESQVSQASSPVIQKSATISYPKPLPSSPYREQIKITRVTKTPCSQYFGKTKQTCRNVCIWWSGVCNWWPVSRHEPLDTTHGTSVTFTYTKLYNLLTICNYGLHSLQY